MTTLTATITARATNTNTTLGTAGSVEADVALNGAHIGSATLVLSVRKGKFVVDVNAADHWADATLYQRLVDLTRTERQVMIGKIEDAVSAAR